MPGRMARFVPPRVGDANPSWRPANLRSASNSRCPFDGFLWRNSSAKHFCHDEDDQGSEKAAASEEVNQRVTNRSKHVRNYYCNHKFSRLTTKLFLVIAGGELHFQLVVHILEAPVLSYSALLSVTAAAFLTRTQ
jgi:hypothetical protein